MTISYPTSLDNFPNPVPTDLEENATLALDHDQQHSNANDAIEALQAKVGITASTPTAGTVLGSTGTGNSAWTAAPSLTSPSLTTPKVTTSINDTNGNELIKVTATGSAVNEVTLVNAATGGIPSIKATGDDTDISLLIGAKGAGQILVDPAGTSAGQTGALVLRELVVNGTNKTGLKAPDSLAADLVYTLPSVQGSSSTFLQNNGSGVLTWAASAGATSLTYFSRPTFTALASGASVLDWSLTGNTTAHLGSITVPVAITVNKFSINVKAVAVAGVFKFALYSEDGQTQMFSLTSGTISSTGITTLVVSSVAVPAGIYYLCVVPVGTVNIDLLVYRTSADDLINYSVSSEPVMEGTITVSAGTLPTTFIPSSGITNVANNTLYCRMDN